MAETRQADHAIKFYESRAANYDGSWHSDFTSRFISHLDIQPGQKVLDLACGTGLLSFLEADAVGPSGRVLGVDVAPSMLAIAAFKKSRAGETYSNVSFVEGDILRLESMDALAEETFDVITVASALVLFPDPKAAIEHWAKYLKPGGVIAMDATHPRNLVAGMVLERVARRLDLPIQYNRAWSRSESTLKHVLESAGVKVEKVVTVDNQSGYGKRSYDMEQWDDFFVENVIVKDVTRTFANNDIRRKAQGVFKEEWEKLAIDGKVEEVDSVFLAVARRPADGSRYISQAVEDGVDVVFEGGCRCGGIRYTSGAAPSDIIVCHCRACQQVSGSGCLPFVQVPLDAFNLTKASTRKTLTLSTVAERTFCSSCGTPVTMAYSFQADQMSITVGSIDWPSLRSEAPKVSKHIFVSEKAPWVQLPDDGAERWGTEESAHLLVPDKAN